MSMLNAPWRTVCLLGVALVCNGGFSATLVVTPVEDATITEKSPGTSLGSDPQLEIGTTGPSAGYKSSRSVLRFDLSAIPTNAVITSASLSLNLEKTAPAVTNLWANLHKLLRPWSETAVTWTNRLSPPAPWSAPGAAPPVDFVAAVTQSNLITTTLGSYTFASNPGMVADVQNWVRNPGSNWGWILISQIQGVGQTECKFTSREGVTAANRPRLTVDYILPPTPLVLVPLTPSNGVFLFRFVAESNRVYTVEATSGSSGTNWSVLTNFGPYPGTSNLVVSDPIVFGARLYRVRTF
jgi:hypothetical protein